MKYSIEKKKYNNVIYKNMSNATFVLTTKKSNRIRDFINWYEKYPLTEYLYIVYNDTSHKIGKSICEDIGYSEEYILNAVEDMKLDNIFYFEDDALPFKYNIQNFKWLITRKEYKNIDIIRLGHLGMVIPSLHMYLFRIINGGSFHANFITKSGRQKILELRKKNKSCIDTILLYNGLRINQYTVPIPLFYQLFKTTESKNEWSNGIINKIINILNADEHPLIFILFHFTYNVIYVLMIIIILQQIYILF